MVTGYKRTWTHIIFTYFKKHYCPYCRTQLQIITCEKIVNHKSEEAKNFDFHSFDTYLVGNIKFVWDELKCFGCGFQITAKEMKKYERSLR